MSRYTVSQACPPTREEIARWDREADYYAYHPPDPSAPHHSPAAMGWGVPDSHKPPVDAFSFVSAMYKRDSAGVPVSDPLRPEYRWSILSVCMAHFLWFRTEAGVNWMLRFFGVEEIAPFHGAYVYFYLNKGDDGVEQSRVLLDKSSGCQLRIFAPCERDLSPPLSSPEDGEISTMKEILRRAREPNARELIAEATNEMYFWVSEQIRDWLYEPKANERWPTYKADRISGPTWVRGLERSPGVRFFEALHQVEANRGRAYRIKDSQGNVLWCGSKDIRVMLRSDYDRTSGQISDRHIEDLYRCSSCGKVRTCTPVTAHQKMCCHCFGSIAERDLRPTLDWCTMRECKNCPEHIENAADLVNLKNRLNREAEFPIRR